MLRPFSITVDIIVEDVAKIKMIISELLDKLKELNMERANIGGSVVLASDDMLIEITIPMPSIEPRFGVPYIPKHVVRIRVTSMSPLEIVRVSRIIDEVCRKIPGVRASLSEKT